MIEEGHALLRGRPTKLLTKGNAYIHRFVRNVDAQPSGSQILIFFLVLAVLISRRPDLFLRPQFFAEDGAIWYAQAYNRGWIASLLIPNAGYLNAVQRLAAGLALTVPLKFAPLLMNCCGLLIQALPVPVLLSARCRTWASLQMRLGMAAIYVFIPNAPEVHVVVTDSQWHLALLLVILAFADPPCSTLGRLTDVVVFTIGSVSGPFGLMLLPLVLIFAWLRKQYWSVVLAVLLTVGGALQIYTLIASPRVPLDRLGATAAILMRILGGHIFLSGILGLNNRLPLLPLPLLSGVTLLGLAICCWCFLKAQLPMKLMLVFAATVLAAGLKNPLIKDSVSLWHALLADQGARYWFFPILAFLWASLWCALSSTVTIARRAGIVVLLLLPIGVLRNWQYPPLEDNHFESSLRMFKAAKPGQKIEIPIYPRGTNMELIKHPD